MPVTIGPGWSIGPGYACGFAEANSVILDYLVVAGGGSGGGWQGGGGGAGGYLTGTYLSLSLNTAYTVTVGAGGTAAAYPGTDCRGTSGFNSVFAQFTAIGGGYGGAYGGTTAAYGVGANGGSGGGGGFGPLLTAGSGTVGPPRQGYNGGPGNNSSFNEGGGGGAGQAGGAPITSTVEYAGSGGAGLLTTGFATNFAGTGNIVSGSATLTLASTTAGALKIGTQVTGAGIRTAQSITITSLTGASPATNRVTINYATQASAPFSPGQVITIEGVTTTTGYNGIWQAVTSNTIATVFASSVTGVATVTGATVSSPATYIESGSGTTWVMSSQATATTNGVALTSSGIYYAGGGGGGPDGSAATSAPGAGGGGRGNRSAAPTAGTPNTGGGGGGAYNFAGGNGGSGVVIIKIPSTNTATFSAGVTSSLDTSVAGYKIYTVTATSTASETVTFT